jgi:hypothetical protein
LRVAQKNICEKTGKVLFCRELLITQVGNTRICGIIMGGIQRLVILAGKSAVLIKSTDGNTHDLLGKIANHIWIEWIMSQIRHEAERNFMCLQEFCKHPLWNASADPAPGHFFQSQYT